MRGGQQKAEDRARAEQPEVHHYILRDGPGKHNMDRFSGFVVIFLALGGRTTMLDEAPRFGGTCDGCGASDVSLMKVSLGKDYFGRVYDRLSPNADSTPKWYCDP